MDRQHACSAIIVRQRDAQKRLKEVPIQDQTPVLQQCETPFWLKDTLLGDLCIVCRLWIKNGIASLEKTHRLDVHSKSPVSVTVVHELINYVIIAVSHIVLSQKQMHLG